MAGWLSASRCPALVTLPSSSSTLSESNRLRSVPPNDMRSVCTPYHRSGQAYDQAVTERLREVDANLLLSLHALLEERNLTRAGTRMTMSQPAMSGALARLRKHFGDELL